MVVISKRNRQSLSMLLAAVVFLFCGRCNAQNTRRTPSFAQVFFCGIKDSSGRELASKLLALRNETLKYGAGSDAVVGAPAALEKTPGSPGSDSIRHESIPAGSKDHREGIRRRGLRCWFGRT